MADGAAGRGVLLRPHAKTHKSIALARLQLDHAAVSIPNGTPAPRLGEVVAILPNHVCPVVEQFDDFVVARDGVAEGRWPVDARGRSR